MLKINSILLLLFHLVYLSNAKNCSELCAECFECHLNFWNEQRCVRKQDCCPEGKQPLNCVSNPCDRGYTECPAALHCIPDYCGNCSAYYYNADWNNLGEMDCEKNHFHIETIIVDELVPTFMVKDLRVVDISHKEAFLEWSHDTLNYTGYREYRDIYLNNRSMAFSGVEDITDQTYYHWKFLRPYTAFSFLVGVEISDNGRKTRYRPASVDEETLFYHSPFVPAPKLVNSTDQHQVNLEQVIVPNDNTQRPEAITNNMLEQNLGVHQPYITANLTYDRMREIYKEENGKFTVGGELDEGGVENKRLVLGKLYRAFVRVFSQHNPTKFGPSYLKIPPPSVDHYGYHADSVLSHTFHSLKPDSAEGKKACPIADLRQPPPHCKHVMELRFDGCYMFKLECTSPSPHSSTIQPTTTDSYLTERQCRQSADSGPCVANVTRWYFNRRYAKCKEFRYDCPMFKVAAPSEGCHHEHLTRLNGCTRPIIMCPDAGCGTLLCEKCQISDNTYTEQCEKRLMGGAADRNRLSGDLFCEDEACSNLHCSEGFKCEFEVGKGPHCIPDVPKLSAIRRCQLKPESGPCKAQIPMFYYDKLYGKCLNFTYGGCGGNLNRFDMEQACMEVCGEIGGLCPVPGLISPPQGCEYKAEASLNGCDSYTLMCPDLGCAMKPCKQCQICTNKFLKACDWSTEECKPIGYKCESDPVCEKWQCDKKSCPTGFQCQFTPDQWSLCVVDLSTQRQCRLEKDSGPC